MTPILSPSVSRMATPSISRLFKRPPLISSPFSPQSPHHLHLRPSFVAVILLTPALYSIRYPFKLIWTPINLNTPLLKAQSIATFGPMMRRATRRT